MMRMLRSWASAVGTRQGRVVAENENVPAEPTPDGKTGPSQFGLKRLFAMTAVAGVVFGLLRVSLAWTTLAILTCTISAIGLTVALRASRSSLRPDRSTAAYGCLSLIALVYGLVGIWCGVVGLFSWCHAIADLLTGNQEFWP
jgi:hypothetical protein